MTEILKPIALIATLLHWPLAWPEAAYSSALLAINWTAWKTVGWMIRTGWVDK
jgi:hypothetical protein